MREYSEKYGEVRNVYLMREKVTKISRGFGFIEFKNGAGMDACLKDTHEISGRKFSCKKAMNVRSARNHDQLEREKNCICRELM